MSAPIHENQAAYASGTASATPESLSRKASSDYNKEKGNDWSEDTGRVSDSALETNVFDDQVLAK